jgi:hypothetical protein
MSIPKVVRDGKVAVLYSPGFGAGWSTWAGGGGRVGELVMFSPEIVALVEAGKRHEITDELCESLFQCDHLYTGGATDLCIAWIDEGSLFVINECVGSESISLCDDSYWVRA